MPHQCTGCGHTFEDGSKEMLSGCPDCGGNKFQFRPAGSSTDTPNGGDTPSPDGDGTPDGSGTVTDPDDTARPSDPPDRPEMDSSSVAETVGRATTRVRDFVASDPTPEPEPDAEWPDEWESGSSVSSDDTSSVDPTASGGEPETSRSDPLGRSADAERSDDDIIDADARRAASERGEGSKEDTAQASARTDVVSSEELDGQAVTDEGSESLDRPEASETGRAPETDPTPDGEVVSEPTGEEPDLTELREQLNDQFESIKILEPGQYELNLMELYDREEYIIALQENGRYVIQVPEQWIGEDVDDR